MIYLWKSSSQNSLHRVLPNLINETALDGEGLQGVDSVGHIELVCGIEEGAGLGSGNKNAE
jgi:acyl carrier protein